MIHLIDIARTRGGAVDTTISPVVAWGISFPPYDPGGDKG